MVYGEFNNQQQHGEIQYVVSTKSKYWVLQNPTYCCLWPKCSNITIVAKIDNFWLQTSLIHFHQIITTNQQSILVFLPKQKK